MELTASEDQVVQCLRRDHVAQGARLAAQLQLSLKTVQRALAKVGYYTSLNHNSTFVTLRDIPQFDELGLWNYQQICFSRLGHLPQTLVHLVEQAAQGCTLQQLQEAVGTRVHNHLSHLLRQGRLGHFRLGRQAVYTSAAPRRQQQQQQARQRALAPAGVPQQGPTVPPGLEALTVIRVLVRRLQTPEASVASLAKSLQLQGVAVWAPQIRALFDFYQLKKTTP
jgi:hypothetical protein